MHPLFLGIAPKPSLGGNDAAIARAEVIKANDYWQNVLRRMYFEQLPPDFEPILYLLKDLRCLAELRDPGGELIDGNTLVVFVPVVTAFGCDRMAAAPIAGISPQSCGATEQHDFHLQQPCIERDLKTIVKLYRQVESLNALLRDPALLAAADPPTTFKAVQQRINVVMEKLSTHGCNRDIQHPAWLSDRILRKPANPNFVWAANNTHMERHFSLGMLHLWLLGIVKRLVLQWHPLAIRRSHGVDAAFKCMRMGGLQMTEFNKMLAKQPSMYCNSTRYESFPVGLKEKALLSGGGLRSLLLPMAVCTVPGIVPRKSLRRLYNACLQISDVVFYLAEQAILDQDSKASLFTFMDSLRVKIVKAYRQPAGADPRMLFSKSNLDFWKFHVFFNHARAYIERYGTLFHFSDNLLEVMMRRGKRLFQRTNGRGMAACMLQLGSRLVEYNVLQALLPMCHEIAAEIKAAKLAAAGAGGAPAPAAAGPPPPPVTRMHYRSHVQLDALALTAAFAAAFTALGLGPFVRAQAVGFSSLTFVRPTNHHREEAELIASPAVDVLGRDMIILTEANGAAPLAAIRSFDPSRCRVVSPLCFFSYQKDGAYECAAVQPLQRCANQSSWNEYPITKPMVLVPGAVMIVPIAHVYDRLRPLKFFKRKTYVQSTDTVHLATYT